MSNDSMMEPLLLPPLEEETFLDYKIERPVPLNLSITIVTDNSSVYRLVIRCLSVYALLLVIIGTLGNTLTIIVLCRRNLRRIVTMRYLIAVSVCDIVSLYGWNLNNFYKFSISPTGNNLEQISLVHCRLFSYLTFVGLQLSSWCLTAVSLDRCLSLHFLHWKQKFGKLSHTKYHLAVLATICLLLNSHILFFNGYRTGSSVKCYATRTNPHYIFPQWERVHLVVYNLCPFTIMFFCNIYIISITVRSARIRTSTLTKKSSSSRHRQLSLMLLIVTFAFVLLTLPSCLYFVFIRHRMSSHDASRTYRHMVQICLSSVQFTSHAINFFLYCFTATNFRNELHNFLSEIFCPEKHALAQRRSTVPNETVRLKNMMKRDSLQIDQRRPTIIPQTTGVPPEINTPLICDDDSN